MTLHELDVASRIIILVLLFVVMLQQRRLFKNQKQLLENDERIFGIRNNTN